MTVTEAAVAEAPTRGPGRPAQSPEEAESATYHRIASLAVSILNTMRKPGRQRYGSERVLRAWLAEDGVSHTTAEVSYALSLAASTGAVVRRYWPWIPRSGCCRRRPTRPLRCLP